VIYRFDGLPTFASYWDWNERNGRIHVSSQIPGFDIRQCPATDHIWNDDAPTKTYQVYREYLKKLRGNATVKSTSPGWQKGYE
jgi:hypothetical protein